MRGPIVLFGKDGQLGFELSKALRVNGDVVLLGRSDCDLTDHAAVKGVLTRFNPSIVVNAAAFTAVDMAEKDHQAAHAINDLAVLNLSKICESTGSLFVHYSTDYIFRGDKCGAYSEDDVPQPLSVYGFTKWAGEQAVRAHCTSHLIFRVGWLYGVNGSNFVKTMLLRMESGASISVVNDQFGTPTSASFVAAATATALRQFQIRSVDPLHLSTSRSLPNHGVYNLAATGKTSWFDYARFIATHAPSFGHRIKCHPEQIIPVSSDEYRHLASIDQRLIALRPSNSCLDLSKLRHAFNIQPPVWEDDVLRTLDLLSASRAVKNGCSGRNV